MMKDIKLGMGKMKYALNHSWKFESWGLAFLSGLCQMVMVLFTTIINYSIIIFTDDIIEIVKDFLAIVVITELDDYFFAEHVDRDDVAK